MPRKNYLNAILWVEFLIWQLLSTYKFSFDSCPLPGIHNLTAIHYMKYGSMKNCWRHCRYGKFFVRATARNFSYDRYLLLGKNFLTAIQWPECIRSSFALSGIFCLMALPSPEIMIGLEISCHSYLPPRKNHLTIIQCPKGLQIRAIYRYHQYK